MGVVQRGAGPARLLDARLVYAADPPCSAEATAGQASVFLSGGHPRWQRPLELASGTSVVLSFDDQRSSFEHPSVLELELADADGATRCRRLPFAESSGPPAWQPEPLAVSLGVRLHLDREAGTVLGRAGLWTGRYQHALELGAGSATTTSRLGEGKVLAIGLSSERVWSARRGLGAVGLELAYEARARWGARPHAADVVHGPRLGLRPLLVNVSPELLPVGPRMGALGFFEIFAALAFAAGDARWLFGIGITADRPL